MAAAQKREPVASEPPLRSEIRIRRSFVLGHVDRLIARGQAQVALLCVRVVAAVALLWLLSEVVLWCR